MHYKGVYLRGERILAGSLTISLICILLLLAACGYNNGGPITTTGSGGNTAPTVVGTPKTLATQKCGIVHTMRLLIVPADVGHVKGMEDCFWQAYQQCHPATL